MTIGNFIHSGSHIRLFDENLRLDQRTLTVMKELQCEMSSRRSLDLWLKPNWGQAERDLSRLWLRPSPAGVPLLRGPGPSKPRPGEISDTLKALYGMSALQNQIPAAHNEMQRQIGEISRAPSGVRGVMIAIPTLIAASTLVALINSSERRDGMFTFLVGRDIPLKLDDGLSFQIQRRGAQITAPVGIPGITGAFGIGAADTPVRPVDYKVFFKIDVLDLARSRGVHPSWW